MLQQKIFFTVTNCCRRLAPRRLLLRQNVNGSNNNFYANAATPHQSAVAAATTTVKPKRWLLEMAVEAEDNGSNTFNNLLYGMRPHGFNPNIRGVKLYSQEEVATLLDHAGQCVQRKKVARAIATMDSLLCGLPPSPLHNEHQQRSSFPNDHNNDDDGHANLPAATTAAETLERCADMALEMEEFCVAEGYLSIGLRMTPGNKKLQRKRNEILPEVDAADDKMLRTIDFLLEESKKNTLNLKDDLLLEQRSNAYRELLVYNTLAIEGSRLNLKEVGHLMRKWAAVENENGNGSLMTTSAAEEEVRGMLDALTFIEQQRLKSNGKAMETITTNFICDLHHRLLLDKPEFGGHFRSQPGDLVWFNGSPSVPVEGNFVEEEMHKFVKNISNNGIPGFDHPVEFAAFIHFAFVYIHPFFDGNGRMARLLMNILLEHHGFPSLIVPVSRRREYISAIQFGEMGDLRRFNRFIGYLMADTLRCFAIDGPYATSMPWTK